MHCRVSVPCSRRGIQRDPKPWSVPHSKQCHWKSLVEAASFTIKMELYLQTTTKLTPREEYLLDSAAQVVSHGQTTFFSLGREKKGSSPVQIPQLS